MKKTSLRRLLALALCAILILPTMTSPASAAEAVAIKDGAYTIVSRLGDNLALDVSSNSTANYANIQVYAANNSGAQIFQITPVKNGWYKIIHIHSRKAVDVSGGSSASGTNVQLYQWNGSDAQLWRFQSNGNGGYYIQNKLGCYLDVYNGKSASGTNVWTYSGNGSDAQVWYLKKACAPAGLTYLKVIKNNAPVRAGNTNKGAVIEKVPSGTILECTGSNYNYKLNKWYQVQYLGKTRHIYSSNVTELSHSYDHLDFDGVTYNICDCGHVTVTSTTEMKVLQANSFAAYGTQYLPLAATAAASDTVLPVGDAIGLLILAYGAVTMATNSSISSAAAQEISETLDFDKYLKANSNTCSTASFRMVLRHTGGNLTYLGKTCYNAAQAYILARFGADVYTTYQANAFLAASMHPGGCFSEIDKFQPNYYYHYHLGANHGSKVGGHIFYGLTPSGLTPA